MASRRFHFRRLAAFQLAPLSFSPRLLIDIDAIGFHIISLLRRAIFRHIAMAAADFRHCHIGFFIAAAIAAG